MKKIPLYLGACAIACVSPQTAFAQWSSAVTGTTNDAAHDYNNTANWTGGTVNDTFNNAPNLGGATLYFSANRTTTGTLTLGYGGFGALTLQGNSVSGPGSKTLTLGGNVFLSNAGNGTTLIGNATAGDELFVDLGGAARTVGANSTGRSVRFVNTVSNGSLIVDTGARVELRPSNTFAGGVVIRNGELAGYDNGSGYFGAGTITIGDTSGSANATLGHRSGSATVANAITVAAGSAGTLSIAPTSGNNTYNGAITLANNLRIAPSSNGSISFNGGITGTGNLLIQQSGGSTTTTFQTGALNFTGSITNQSTAGGSNGVRILSSIGSNVTSVTQNGALKLTLGGVNSYTGGTVVTSGTLETNATGTLGAGDIDLADTAGVILTLGNASSIADAASLSFGNLSTINLNFSGSDTIYSLFNTTDASYMTAGTWTATQLNDFFGVSSFNGIGSLTVVTAVPEPATWGMVMAGGLAVMVLARRRARRR